MNKEKLLEIIKHFTLPDAENNTVIYEESFVDLANRIMQECGNGEAVAYMHPNEQNIISAKYKERFKDYGSDYDDFKIPLYLHPQNKELEDECARYRSALVDIVNPNNSMDKILGIALEALGKHTA